MLFNGSNKSEPKTGEITGFLGKGIRFEGRLEFAGTVRIDGEFTGQIRSSGVLIVGQGGRVQGDVRVGSLLSSGDVVGSVVATKAVTLYKSAYMEGELLAPSVRMDQGARVQGQVRIGSVPLEPAADE